MFMILSFKIVKKNVCDYLKVAYNTKFINRNKTVYNTKF